MKTQKLSCQQHFLVYDEGIRRNAAKVQIVIWITFFTMLGEIYYGFTTGSMALLADGWHMATHLAALSITFLTYKLATSSRIVRRFNFGGGKIIALGGFTSAVVLLFVVFVIGKEAIERLIRPEEIQFNEALLIAVIGLVINFACAYVLRDTQAGHHGHSLGHSHADGTTHAHGHDEVHTHDHGHSHDHKHATRHDHKHATRHDHKHAHNHSHEHDHGHSHTDGSTQAHGHGESHFVKPALESRVHFHDHNIRGAYLHVVADALTSVGAILALFAGKYYNLNFLDPLIGLVSALVILRWAYQLVKATGWELLDGHATNIDFAKLRARIESQGAEIVDLHVWHVAPQIISSELVIQTKQARGIEHYRHILTHEFGVHHTVIEEHVC